MTLQLLIAEAGDAPANPPPAGDKPPAGGLESLLGSPLLMIAMLVFIFYFIVLRPGQKEKAKRQNMLGAIKKNDRVLTIGGIYGVVMNVHREADEITLKVDEDSNIKLKVTMSSIARVVSNDLSEKESSK
jgi:preprotein translocase subunit YajC